MRCLQGSGWLYASKGADFTVACKQSLTEPLLADAVLAHPRRVTSGDLFISAYMGTPPPPVNSQILFQQRTQ